MVVCDSRVVAVLRELVSRFAGKSHKSMFGHNPFVVVLFEVQ